MRWTTYASHCADSRMSAEPQPEALKYPHNNLEDELAYGSDIGIRAFCGWAAWRHGDSDVELFAQTDPTFDSCQPGERYELIKNVVAPLPTFAACAGDGDALWRELVAAYEAYLNDFEVECINLCEGGASLLEPTRQKARLQGTQVPQQLLPQGFVCGHGSYTAGGADVRVPPGMNLHFMVKFDELLGMDHSFVILGDGPAAKSKQTYTGGAPVPNYAFSPEHCDCDVALAVQANVHEMPLYFIGDTSWDAAAGRSCLCTAPDACNKRADGTHGCKGVLGTLHNVQNLHFMTCRGEESRGLEAKQPRRLPGELFPKHRMKEFFAGLEAGLAPRHSVAVRLADMQCEDPVKLAVRAGNNVVRPKMTVEAGIGLLFAEGLIVYHSMYLKASKEEQGWLDSDEWLLKARMLAEEFIASFSRASSEERALMMSELYIHIDKKNWKKTIAFLGYRIDGFKAWLRNAAFYDEMIEINREAIRLGGKYSAHYANSGVLIDSDRAGGLRDANLLASFSKGLRFSLHLKPPTPSQDAYLVTGRAKDRPLPPSVQEAVVDLIRTMYPGQDFPIEFMD